MKHLLKILMAAMVAAPTTAWTQEAATEPSDAAAGVQVTPPSAEPAAPPTPVSPEPVPVPPVPTDSTQQAVEAAQPPSPPAGVPEGQWVYTGQYGWVWMPYGQSYTYVPDDGDPYMYVYYPSYGWQWVVAPWVFGWGPRPYWGTWGVRHFAWYSRPWFRGRVDHGFRSFSAPHPHARPHFRPSGAFVARPGGGMHFGAGVHVAPHAGRPGGRGGHVGGGHFGGRHASGGHFGGRHASGGHFGGGHAGGAHGGSHGGGAHSGGHGGGHR